MSPIVKHLIKTVLVVGLLAVPWSMAWEFIFPGKIYHCTDDGWLGYLTSDRATGFMVRSNLWMMFH
jgi:hypothetical protein